MQRMWEKCGGHPSNLPVGFLHAYVALLPIKYTKTTKGPSTSSPQKWIKLQCASTSIKILHLHWLSLLIQQKKCGTKAIVPEQNTRLCCTAQKQSPESVWLVAVTSYQFKETVWVSEHQMCASWLCMLGVVWCFIRKFTPVQWFI